MDNLDKELDHLYALEPGGFVAERDRLVRDLRGAGRRDEAARVKALRKPSVSAWAINQLARRERRQVDLLLDASHRLREAQQGALAGEGRRRLDEAVRSQREALNALGEAARRILAEADRASETTLSRIMGTLQAAAVSPEGRELLARGRLAGDLKVTGFELLEPSAETRPKRQARPRRAEKAAPRRKQAARKQLEDARLRLREARARAKVAAQGVRDVEQEARQARRELARAEERLQKAQAAATEAQAAVKEAEKHLREVERSAG